jgi:hypothetical protein
MVMKPYRIDRLNVDGTLTPRIGVAQLPDDLSSEAFAAALVAWVRQYRAGDPAGCGYQAVQLQGSLTRVCTCTMPHQVCEACAGLPRRRVEPVLSDSAQRLMDTVEVHTQGGRLGESWMTLRFWAERAARLAGHVLLVTGQDVAEGMGHIGEEREGL